MKNGTKPFLFQTPLFTAFQDEAIEQALASDADALFIEAKPLEAKNEQKIEKIFREKSNGGPLCFFFVAPETSLLRLEALVKLRPDGVIIHAPEGLRSVMQVGAKLAVCETENGIPKGSTAIIVKTPRTAREVFFLQAYAVPVKRLAGLLWPPDDLANALGVTNEQAPSLTLAKSFFLLAAAAAQVQAIDSMSCEMPIEILMRKAKKAKEEGFTAKVAKERGHVGAIKTLFNM